MVRRVKHAFRMPLNSPDKGFAVDRKRFDESVIRFCHDCYFRSGNTDPLMMQTVHFQTVHGNQSVQRSARNQNDAMDRFVVRGLLTVCKRRMGL